MKKKNSKLSIIAFVLCITVIFSIVGIILAIVDLMKKDKTQTHTLSIVGLIVIGVFVTGATMLDEPSSNSTAKSSSASVASSSAFASSIPSISSDTEMSTSIESQSSPSSSASSSVSCIPASSVSEVSEFDPSAYDPYKVNYSTAPVINGAKTAKIGTFAYYLYPGTKKDFSNDDLAKFAKSNVDGLDGTYNYFVLVFNDDTCIFWGGCNIYYADYGSFSDQHTYIPDSIKYTLCYDDSNNTYTKSDN